MRTGFIKWFSSRRNYGFIRYNNELGKWYEVFVHGSSINFNVRDGDFVCFQMKDTLRGPKAVNVRKGKKVIEVA